jgi:hypothetical protein
LRLLDDLVGEKTLNRFAAMKISSEVTAQTFRCIQTRI